MGSCKKVLYIVLMMLSSNSHGAPLDEKLINKDLTGHELIKMGNILNKPLLALLGATLVKTEYGMHRELNEVNYNTNKQLSDKIDDSKNNLQDGIDKLKSELCKETRCAAWSEWSKCSASWIGTFGARTRSRKCGGTSSICSTGSSETVEKDNQICQGKTCKHTLTKNKFCIKLYQSGTKTQKDAREDCHNEGGHLMNMDSEVKVNDIHEYFTNISLTSLDVWIDGSRSLPNGDWKYEYRSDDTKFSIWHGTEPGSSDNCKVFKNYNHKWYGRQCTDSYHYLCEIL